MLNTPPPPPAFCVCVTVLDFNRMDSGRFECVSKPCELSFFAHLP